MEKIEKKLMKKAKKRFKLIYPCSRSQKFKDCYTRYGDTLYFWFDTADHNTHVVFEKMVQPLP